MVIFDVGASFLLSGFLARRFEGRRPELCLSAATLTMAVPGLYFLERYPEWDWQYLLNPSGLPPGVYALFVAAIIFAALLGRRLALAAPRIHLGFLAVFLIYCGVFARRTVYVGTSAEYFADKAAFLPTGFCIDVAIAVVWAVIVLGTTLAMGRTASPAPVRDD